MGVGIESLKNVSYTDPRFKLYNNLQADAARFAAFREAQKQRELAAVKTDLDKERIEKRYKEYMATEKQGIFANAAAAERWTGFQENADLYPNLEWRTAGDSDVRTEHARLDGLVLPINDTFWRSHTPPLGFGCRCELIQTDAKPTKKEGYKDTPAPKGFDFNPGIDQQVFADSAGYYTSASKADTAELKNSARLFYDRATEAALKKEMIGQTINANGQTIIFNKKGIEKVRNINDFDKKSFALNCLYDLKNILKAAKYTTEDYLKSPEKMVANKGIVKIHKWRSTDFEVMARENTEGKVFFYYIRKLK